MYHTFCVEIYFALIFRFGRLNCFRTKSIHYTLFSKNHINPKMKVWRTSFDIKGTTLQNCSFVLQLSQQSVFSFGCALFLALKQ